MKSHLTDVFTFIDYFAGYLLRAIIKLNT